MHNWVSTKTKGEDLDSEEDEVYLEELIENVSLVGFEQSSKDVLDVLVGK